jgi:predicted ATPase with chaperone activity
VYGPPGNGKTVIAQATRNLLAGDVMVPHAVDVEGQIIRVFDPVNHEAIGAAAHDNGIERRVDGDARWVRCRPPLVTVGGELTLESLELSATAPGLYQAPVQMVANGGVLVIDDFGRQHASPRALLNRWIVPLETRVDHLRLQTGQKIEIPFLVFVVFATNLKPADLADEAFLRRIQYKVRAESPTPAEFVEIFVNYCRDHDLPGDPALAREVIEHDLRPRRVPLRGCQPRDLIEHALSLASYLGAPRALTPELLSAACDTYFVADHDEELETV